MKKIDSIIDKTSGGATEQNIRDTHYGYSDKFVTKIRIKTTPDDYENTKDDNYDFFNEVEVAEMKKIDSLNEIYKY